MSRIPSYGQIGAPLPFGQLGAQMDRYQNLYAAPPQEALGILGQMQASGYRSAAQFNEGLYNAIQGGYGTLLANQTGAADALSRGYTDLSSRARQVQEGIGGMYSGVRDTARAGAQGISGGYDALLGQTLAGIQGIGQTRATDIQNASARELAAAQSNLISRGLGSSSVLGSIQRGISTDRERNLIANAEMVAGLQAGYRSQLGQAGLGYRERALGQDVNLGLEGAQYRERALGQEVNLGLEGLTQQERAGQQMAATQQRQLDWLNTVDAPYPDAGMYQALAQQIGAAQQAGADRNQVLNLAQQQQRAADQAARGAGQEVASPTFGGGFARGTGGLAPPIGNYGATYGTNALAVPSVGAAAFGGVQAPALVGAGGGFSGAAGLAPGVPMESAGAYTGYGGQSVAGGFGGGYGTAPAAPVAAGGGSYTGYRAAGGVAGGGTAGFGGGYGGFGGYGNYDDLLAGLDDLTWDEVAAFAG